MHSIEAIIAAALLSEAVWETGKLVWQKGKLSIDRVGALLTGLLIAVGAGLDLFKLVDISFFHPLIGQVLTGILLSRGANFVHDLLKTAEIVVHRNQNQITE
ncbi:MAG: hypothetical protein GXZ09_03240 [Syntrophomonadaceae bacterium]|jgi:hypothetical protein|nr:hypothetical protein [Syntrophomonadaceae bacterium]